MANDAVRSLNWLGGFQHSKLGPAKTVRPGVTPPSILPLNATFTIGTLVGTISCSVKNLLFDRISVVLIFEFFFSLSIIDIV